MTPSLIVQQQQVIKHSSILNIYLFSVESTVMLDFTQTNNYV